MILGFYPVTSDYERHTFDDSTPEEIVKAITKLDAFKFYNVSEAGYQTKMNSLSDLIEDYNDELLDGGWWSVLIDMAEDEYINLIKTL